jgi:ornithine cyclodeaminase
MAPTWQGVCRIAPRSPHTRPIRHVLPRCESSTPRRPRHALPFDALIRRCATLFAAGCVVPPRQVHEIDAPPGTGAPRSSCRRGPRAATTASRSSTSRPATRARGLPALHASYLLHDAATGAPLALIDGDQITARPHRRGVGARGVVPRPRRRAPPARRRRGQVARLLPAAYRVCAADRAGVLGLDPRAEEARPGARLADAGVAAAASRDLEARSRAPPNVVASPRSRPSR